MGPEQRPQWMPWICDPRQEIICKSAPLPQLFLFDWVGFDSFLFLLLLIIWNRCRLWDDSMRFSSLFNVLFVCFIARFFRPPSGHGLKLFLLYLIIIIIEMQMSPVKRYKIRRRLSSFYYHYFMIIWCKEEEKKRCTSWFFVFNLSAMPPRILRRMRQRFFSNEKKKSTKKNILNFFLFQ